MNKKITLLCTVFFIAILLFGGRLQAQNCGNFDFFNNNFYNWTGKTGNNTGGATFNWTVTNIPAATLNAGIYSSCTDGNRFKLINNATPTTDPYVPLKLPMGKIVRLGNPCNGGQAEALVFTYIPTAANSLLQLKYALVSEAPHSGDGRNNPTFEIHVRRMNHSGVYETTADLQCNELVTILDPSNPTILNDTSFHTISIGYGGYIYKTWTTVAIDLRRYIGESIEIEIAMSDCSYTGHFGYAYFTGSCQPMALTNTSYISATGTTDTAAIVQAPEGYTYKWKKASDTSAVISTNRILSLMDSTFGTVDSLALLCELTSLHVGTNGTRCTTHLEVTAYNHKPIADFIYTNNHCDTNRTVSFTSTSRQRYSPLDTNTIEWDFGDGSSVLTSVVNPQHTYTSTGTYIVKYKVASLITGSNGDTIGWAFNSVKDTITILEGITNVIIERACPTTAIISWDAPIEQSQWQLQYQPQAGDNVIVKEVSTTRDTLLNLTPNTAYELKIRPICGEGDTGNFTPSIDLQTDTCQTVSGVYGHYYDDVFIARWDSSACHQSWEIVAVSLGALPETGTPVQITSTMAYLESTPIGAYDFYVRGYCGTNVYSDWVRISWLNINKINTAAIKVILSPNPAKKYIKIDIEGVLGKIEVTLINPTGKIIKTEDISLPADKDKTISVQGLTKGTYLVRLVHKDWTKIEKLIVL